MLPAFSQVAKPNFSGHWQLDKAKSDLGGALATNILETIEQKGFTVAITSTYVSPRGNMKRLVKFTTDGAPNINIVAGHELTTKTCWEGARMVTVVRDPRGLGITETHALSKSRKIMTVSIDTGSHKQRLVMLKR